MGVKIGPEDGGLFWREEVLGEAEGIVLADDGQKIGPGHGFGAGDEIKGGAQAGAGHFDHFGGGRLGRGMAHLLAEKIVLNHGHKTTIAKNLRCIQRGVRQSGAVARGLGADGLIAQGGTMSWHRDILPGLVRALAGRPGKHEAIRVHIAELLREGFGAVYEEIDHEAYLLAGSGRIDMLWGATVIELKSDLRREMAAVQARMPDYLRDAERRSGRPATGLATDGASFIGLQLRDGVLVELARYETRADNPAELLAWLELLLADRPGIAPSAEAVRQAFGRASLIFARSRIGLEALWAGLRDDPEVALKRDLWLRLLGEAYGEEVGDDSLFLQHTYLTMVVKAIAARVLGLPVDDPAALLAGQALADEGIQGAVEADFFDWPLRRPEGAALVRQVAQQAARFDLARVETDVLKVLYESLVDPVQRHDLGEYYTPDWLAFRVVREAVDDPLRQRVLDPACGSGTFLFHALRRLVAAGRAEGWDGARILAACAEQVRGLDVHPVAVTLARVTWLLALGDVLAERRGTVSVPVFLGDAMQWNLRRYLGGADVVVEVPGGKPLHVPAGFAENQAAFEQGLDELNQGPAGNSPRL